MAVRMSRRMVVVMPAAAAATALLAPVGAVLSETSRDGRDHFIPPFRKRPEYHHTYLAMQKSAPKVEARLSEWRKLTKRQTEELRTSQDKVIVRWRRGYALIPAEQSRSAALAVNRLVNENVRYVSDWDHDGVREKWYGPLQTILEGGDCEDYSLLKGYLLFHKGWPLNAMHLVAGILISGQAHMMLGVQFANGERAMLDNLSMDLRPRPFNAWTPKYQIGPEQASLAFLQAT